MVAQFNHSNRDAIDSKGSEEAQRISNPMLLPLKAAADALGVTLWCMRSLVWNGDIEVVQFPGSRKIYITMDALKKLVRENERRL